MYGICVFWPFAVNLIPQGWVVCDGNNGTPNMVGRYAYGANVTHPIGTFSDAITHNHTGDADNNYDFVTGLTDQQSDCLMEGSDIDYAYDDPYFDQCLDGHQHGIDLQTDGHEHSLIIGAGGIIPPFYSGTWIMKL